MTTVTTAHLPQANPSALQTAMPMQDGTPGAFSEVFTSLSQDTESSPPDKDQSELTMAISEATPADEEPEQTEASPMDSDNPVAEDLIERAKNPAPSATDMTSLQRSGPPPDARSKRMAAERPVAIQPDRQAAPTASNSAQPADVALAVRAGNHEGGKPTIATDGQIPPDQSKKIQSNEAISSLKQEQRQRSDKAPDVPVTPARPDTARRDAHRPTRPPAEVQPAPSPRGSSPVTELPSVVPDRPLFVTGRTRAEPATPPRRGLENRSEVSAMQPALRESQTSLIPAGAMQRPEQLAAPDETSVLTAAVEVTSRSGPPVNAPPPVPTAPPSVNPEAARQVASQMAVAVLHGRGGQTEIALSPKELGKVRMTLSALDGTVSLVLQVERPETADLMRRHLDTLQQEFRAMGFADIDFDFRDQNGRGTADNDSAEVIGPAVEEPAVERYATTAEIAVLPETAALDLRL